MTEEDLTEMKLQWSEWTKELKPKTVLLFCPSDEERTLAKEIFVDAEISEKTEKQYNLDTLRSDSKTKYDLIIVSNCFMCSTDPAFWMRNLHLMSDNVWIQELIRAWRNGHEELSPETGDITRFCKPPEHLARVNTAFDLTTFGSSLKKFHAFAGKSGYRKSDGREMDSLKFVAWITAPAKSKKVVKLQLSPEELENEPSTIGNFVSKNKKK